jgi:hypothetical protein
VHARTGNPGPRDDRLSRLPHPPSPPDRWFGGRGTTGRCIRIGAELRKPDVTVRRSEDLWIIQPLLEAGLGPEEVQKLLLRVSFACLVTAGRCDVSDATTFLGSQPAVVQAAWVETVDRMLRVPEPSSGR